MRSWPSLAAHRTQPATTSSTPSSAMTHAQGHQPRLAHSAWWMPEMVTNAPAGILPVSWLVRSGLSRTTSFSRTRYFPPTSQGTVLPGVQERRGPPSAPTELLRPRPTKLARRAGLPLAMLWRCISTTSMPKRFTGSNKQSPAVVSGLIQPMRPLLESLTSARRRASPLVPSSTPSSRTTTSFPGVTSATHSLERLFSFRTVAGFFTR
mmetsp:Transcript_120866/g.337261  ORF Transcript_120866/g.337261 Transcript_120866/m.337261 type:complete len:208 (-) Transcript_120866:430-1053(-)